MYHNVLFLYYSKMPPSAHTSSSVAQEAMTRSRCDAVIDAPAWKCFERVNRQERTRSNLFRRSEIMTVGEFAWKISSKILKRYRDILKAPYFFLSCGFCSFVACMWRHRRQHSYWRLFIVNHRSAWCTPRVSTNFAKSVIAPTADSPGESLTFALWSTTTRGEVLHR